MFKVGDLVKLNEKALKIVTRENWVNKKFIIVSKRQSGDCEIRELEIDKILCVSSDYLEPADFKSIFNKLEMMKNV